MRYALFLFTALSLAGCVSQRAVLVNDRGEELTCETTASGIFPSLVIGSKQQECISEAERRGYRLKEEKSKAEGK
jgi:hypothetical protein